MSDILADDMADMSIIVEQVRDESRRKDLKARDEQEDYLDEGLFFPLFTYFLPALTLISYVGNVPLGR